MGTIRIITGGLLLVAVLAPRAVAHHADLWLAGRTVCMALPNTAPPPPPGQKALPSPQAECLAKLGPMPSEPARTVTSGSPATVRQGGEVVQQIRGNEVLLPGDQMTRGSVRIQVESLPPTSACLLPGCARFRIKADQNATVAEVAGSISVSHKLPNHQQKSTWNVNVTPKRRMENLVLSFASFTTAPPPGGALAGLKAQWKLFGSNEVPPIACSYTPKFSWPVEEAVAAGCMANGECDADVQWGSQSTQPLPPDNVKGNGKQFTQSFSIRLNAKMKSGSWGLRCFGILPHPEPMVGSNELTFNVGTSVMRSF
jgi:hypothetical protein